MNLGSISEGVQDEAITRLEASPHLEGFRARRRGVGDQEHARHNSEAEIAAPGLHSDGRLSFAAAGPAAKGHRRYLQWVKRPPFTSQVLDCLQGWL